MGDQLYQLFAYTFLGSSGVFLLLDLVKPHLRYPNRLNGKPWVSDSERHRKLLLQYVQFFPTVTLNLVGWLYLFFKAIQPYLRLDTQPVGGWMWVKRFIKEQLWLLFAFECLFYYSHKWLHRPSCYKHIHYKHHEMVDTIGMGAIYAHPIELLVSNFIPFAVPVLVHPFVQELHTKSVVFWTASAGIYIVLSHSGYPYPHPTPRHVIHHANHALEYGTIGLLDFLHRTRA